MKKRQQLLTDELWELIGPLLPEAKRRNDRRGRPAVLNRNCLEGILWLLQTGAAWKFSSRRVSFALDLLATVEAVGGNGSLAQSPAYAAECIG
jgi:hypothetical protein